jgi:hypothetical protein
MKIGIWKKLVLQRAWAVPDSTDRNYQTRVQLLITEVGYLSPKVENGRLYHVCTTTDIVNKEGSESLFYNIFTIFPGVYDIKSRFV